MDHGLEVIDGADGAKFGLGTAEKGFVDLPLDRGAAVGGAEGHAQASGGHKFRRQAGLIENLLGHLTGVIRHGPHGLAVSAPEVEINRIIHRPEDLGVDELRQEVILPERLDAGDAPPEAVHDLRARMADGRDGRTGRDDDSSSLHGRTCASFRAGTSMDSMFYACVSRSLTRTSPST